MRTGKSRTFTTIAFSRLNATIVLCLTQAAGKASAMDQLDRLWRQFEGNMCGMALGSCDLPYFVEYSR